MITACVETWSDPKEVEQPDAGDYLLSLPVAVVLHSHGSLGEACAATPTVDNYTSSSGMPIYWSSTIRSLPDNDLAVGLPFTVVTEQYAEDNYVSGVQEAMVYASGDHQKGSILLYRPVGVRSQPKRPVE